MCEVRTSKRDSRATAKVRDFAFRQYPLDFACNFLVIRTTLHTGQSTLCPHAEYRDLKAIRIRTSLGYKVEADKIVVGTIVTKHRDINESARKPRTHLQSEPPTVMKMPCGIKEGY